MKIGSKIEHFVVQNEKSNKRTSSRNNGYIRGTRKIDKKESQEIEFAQQLKKYLKRNRFPFEDL